MSHEPSKVDAGDIKASTALVGPSTFNAPVSFGIAGVSEATLNKILDALGAKAPTGPVVAVRSNFADAHIVWNRLFTGREEDLARLHTALAAKSQAVMHAVTGAGGVGKTELARAFAFIFADEYEGVWWIDASDGGFSDSISRTFKAATSQPAPNDARPEDLAQQLSQLWSQGRHLVILDNVESAGRLSLFALGGGSRVLATTRKDLSAAATVEPFRVDVISEDAAVQLLHKQTVGRVPSPAEADLRAIARELGCHTLAVALAGAYLARYGDVSAAEYLALVAAQSHGEAEPREDGEDNDPLLLRYRHSVRSCLTLHFSKFAGKKEMVLLGLASFCHSTGIPMDLLAAAAKVDLPAARKLARNLADVSIVTYEAALSIHRLTQGVVRSMLDKETMSLMIDALVGTLVPAFEDHGDPSAWPRQSALAPHADAVVGHAAAVSASERAAKLANELGMYLKEAGRYADARRTYETCLGLTAKTFGAEHPNMAALLSNLAVIQQDQEDLPAARASMERAIAIKEKHFAPGHPTFAATYNNLAMILMDLGDYDEALRYKDLSMQIERTHIGEDHPRMSASYSNLAMLQLTRAEFYESRGELAEPKIELAGARANMERAIAIQQKHFAFDHPTFATIYNNLATICFAEGDRAAACVNFKKALDILLKHFDENHPNVKNVRESMEAAGCGA